MKKTLKITDFELAVSPVNWLEIRVKTIMNKAKWWKMDYNIINNTYILTYESKNERL